ncbi:hypothetical protein [Dyadobacter sp. NIV53]|uniref:hypothetical protein n=1 Tax=Dyadobacter sp. NIV53 TaxID=2861765 RepID=UPI001C87E2DC|nr:hypothetical protein [Dyadobacter sp. NIV53]
MIRDFCDDDFKRSRSELIQEGKELDYKISKINITDGVLTYGVVIPGINGLMEYECSPKLGELTVRFRGDIEFAQLQYDEIKSKITWEGCEKREVGELCEAFQEMEAFPLKTHFLINIVKDDQTGIFVFKRIISPK